MLLQSHLKKEELHQDYDFHRLQNPEIKQQNTRPAQSNNKTKYQPTEAELCEAVMLIKKVMPNRSLERAITLMHQILNKNIPLQVVFSNKSNANTAATQKEREGQVTKTYEKNSLLKTTFANDQQQAKYKEKRLVAKSFVGKGYGHQFALEQFTQAKFNATLSKENYKRIIGIVITQAFRKLQSFLIQDCSKPINPLTKEEMTKIITPLLSSTHFGPHLPVFKKFLRLIYGLSKVVLCEGETMSFYEAALKEVRGTQKNPENENHNDINQAKCTKIAGKMETAGLGNEAQYARQINNGMQQRQMGKSEQKLEYYEGQSWSQDSDNTLINTYLAQGSVTKTHEVLQHRNSSIFTIERIRSRIHQLIQRAVTKLQSDNSITQMQLSRVSQSEVLFISRSKLGGRVRAKLLTYLQQRYSLPELAAEIAIEMNQLLANYPREKPDHEFSEHTQMEEEDSQANNNEIYDGSENEVKQQTEAHQQ